MEQASVRSTTATTGRTVLAIVAILSLLLSLFAIVRPVIANHLPPDGPEVMPTSEAFPGGDPICPAGTFGFRFNNPADGPQIVTFPGGATATITLDVNGNQLTFVIDGAVAAEVVLKATETQNVYDYSGFPGGGIAHDDGLVSPATDSISHVDFCLIPIVAEIEVTKTGPDLSKVGDPTAYTITITNTGNVELFLESVDDSLAGDLTAAVVAQCGPLAVDEICTFSYNYTPVQGDADPLLNTVEVSANSASDFTGAEATGSASESVNLFQPGITVDKTAAPAEVEVGENVSYTITITNTSSTDSPNLVVDSISDTLAGDLTADCAAELASGDVCMIEYTLEATQTGEMCNTVSVETNPAGFTNEIDGEDTACVTVVGPPVGSITIVKEIDCEECETRTPGFWFNAAGSHDEETNALMAQLAANDGGDEAGAVEVNIDGVEYDFTDAASVRAFVEADRSGDWDGETGLSRDGALLRHYLATWLNVLLNGEECDLLSRELNGQTVEEILAEAAAALAADDEAAEVAALEKLTAINESDDAEENPLSCDSEGTSADGFMFELFAEGDLETPVDSGTTGDDGAGTLIFEELPLGTYILVETGNDQELDCEIVSVEGAGAVLNEDGTVTITIDEENPDVTITVTNDCEQGGGEENPGDITVIKEAGDDPTEPFGFSASWDADGFTLMDGDAEFSGDLEAGVFTVTEELTDEQIAAGWSLAEIDCGDADVMVDGSTVTITLHEGESVECTFTNELEEEENGELEIIKFFCPTEGDDAIFVFGPLLPEPVSLRTLGEEGELPSDEGCTLGAPSEDALGATFSITGGGLTEPFMVTTEWDEIETIQLPPGTYEITELGTGLTATFEIVEGGDTAVVVFNFEEEDGEQGQLKILKFFCEGESDVVFTVVDGDAGLGDIDLPAECSNPEPGDADFTLKDGENTTGVFDLGDDGARLIPLAVGTYTLTEVNPNEGTSDEFDVTAGETTTVIVFDFEAGEVEPGNPPTNGGSGPGGEGTLGGNPTVPNTAMDLPVSPMSAVLALLMLSMLGVAGVAARAEVRRRR